MGETQSLVDEEFALLRTCLSTITELSSAAGTGTSSGRSVEPERVGPDGPLPLPERHPEVWRITPGGAAGVKAAAQPFRAHSGKGAPPSLSGGSESGPAHLRPATPQDEGLGKRDDGGRRREELPGGVGRRPTVGVGASVYQEAQVSLDQELTPYHVGEAKAAQRWIEEQAAHFPGLAVLTGDALLADRSLCTAILEHGGDYMVKLKKTSQPCTRM